MRAEPQQSEITRFLAAIHGRYGYDLRGYSPTSMRRRVQATLRRTGIASVGELAARSVADPEFFAEVLDGLTVHVSEMFRDPAFFRAFRSQVVPRLRTYPRLSIWSCGCATGEEAYSAAIVLNEEGLYERCQIYATDLSAAVLDRGRQGIYPAAALATASANYAAAGGLADLEDYFTAAYGQIAARDGLRRNILFLHHDLVGDHVFAEMDVILCRNVLIYFGRELQGRVYRKLAESLRPGGLLCLGPNERLPPAAAGLFASFVPEHRIYRQALTS